MEARSIVQCSVSVLAVDALLRGVSTWTHRNGDCHRDAHHSSFRASNDRGDAPYHYDRAVSELDRHCVDDHHDPVCRGTWISSRRKYGPTLVAWRGWNR